MGEHLTYLYILRFTTLAYHTFVQMLAGLGYERNAIFSPMSSRLNNESFL